MRAIAFTAHGSAQTRRSEVLAGACRARMGSCRRALRVLSTRSRVVRTVRETPSRRALHLETRYHPYNTPNVPPSAAARPPPPPPVAQTSDRTALNNKLFPSCTQLATASVYLGRAVSSLSVDIARVEVSNASVGSEDVGVVLRARLRR